MAVGDLNPIRLQLGIEGWPVRREESVTLNEGFSDEERILVAPPNFRLSIGSMLDGPTGDRFVKYWRGGIAAEWQGGRQFGFASYIGAKFFRTPWEPSLGIKIAVPLSTSEEAERERGQLAPQLAWSIANYKNWRVEAAVNFNLLALASSDPLTNGPSAGLLISFGKGRGSGFGN